MNTEDLAKLEEVYARVPKMVNCKGKCAFSCGPIDMSDLERERIKSQGGVDIPYRLGGVSSYDCPALSAFNTCTVYAMRPLICRLWGTTKAIACPQGCRPERWLTDAECMDLLFQVVEIGGNARLGDFDITSARALATDPVASEAYGRLFRGDHSAAEAILARGREMFGDE